MLDEAKLSLTSLKPDFHSHFSLTLFASVMSVYCSLLLFYIRILAQPDVVLRLLISKVPNVGS